MGNEETKFTLSLLQRTLTARENDAADLKDRYREAEKIYKQHDEEFQPLKRNAESLYDEALKTTNNISPQHSAFKSLNKLFEKLPATINDINNELEIANAKVFCMAKNVDAENVSATMEDIILHVI